MLLSIQISVGFLYRQQLMQSSNFFFRSLELSAETLTVTKKQCQHSVLSSETEESAILADDRLVSVICKFHPLCIFYIDRNEQSRERLNTLSSASMSIIANGVVSVTTRLKKILSFLQTLDEGYFLEFYGE